MILAGSMLGQALAQQAVPQAKPDARIRLGLPYPISGPAEIQAPDRATRRYRIIAAHAVPPVSDTLAKLIADAIALGDYGSVDYVRRTGLSAFEAGARDHGVTSKRSVHLLLAGDDLIREATTRPADAGNPLRLRLVEPMALMPFVLLCTAGRCAGEVATIDPTLRAQLRAGIRSIGSAGERSTGHRAAQLLLGALNSDTLLVTYKGGSAALSALIAAEVDAAFVPLPLVLGYIGQSKVRALGLTSERRFESLRSVPTLAELGLTETLVEGWFALFATELLPPQYATDIGSLVRAYRLEPSSRMEILARGLTPVEVTASQFEMRLGQERERWRAESSVKR